MMILSLQSSVAYGHVGNSAAVFPLQRLGIEVLPVNTVQFSNNPDYGRWGGDVLEARHVRAVVDGLDANGFLASCRAVLSGYLGEAASGEAALAAARRAKAHNPQALYLCDPVMGDVDSGFYVRPGIAEFFLDHALALADIITPNAFELEVLAGRKAPDLPAALALARDLLARGPKMVVATGLEQTDGTIVSAAVSAEGSWLVRTPHLPMHPPTKGTGDILSALLLGRLVLGHTLPQSLSLAVSSLWGILEATRKLARREMALIPAQTEIPSPTRVFPAEPAP